MTQKELILAWGQGESGQQEQLEQLTMDELIYTYRQLKAVGHTSNVPNIKANLALIIREIRQRIQQNTTTMFFVACKGEYPYQETSNYGVSKIDTSMLSIRLFPNREEAQETADIINRRTTTLGESRGRESEDIVHVTTLGNASGMTAVQHLERMGVNAVFFGAHKDDKTDLNLRAETLTRHDKTEESFDFYNVAAKTYALLNIIEQAENEKRPEEEVQAYRSAALQVAAGGKIGFAISQADYDSGECHPAVLEHESQEYLELFTDWATMVDCLGTDAGVYMAIGDWDNVIGFGKPVMINRQITVDFENAYQLGCLTEKGRVAMAYIAQCYQLDVTTADGIERSCRILNDIRAAEPICNELYAGLKLVSQTNEKGNSEQVVVFDFPENEKDLVSVNGNTAKQFVDNHLCENPAAAYHVLAALFNDKDGSALHAFENAELYD